MVKSPTKIYNETWAKEVTRAINENYLLLVSPNGTKYKGTIDNTGTLVWTAI